MASTSEIESPQQIEIGPNLTLPQLNNVKNNLDRELMFIQDSLQSLKMAQQKFHDSGECLESITPDYEGKEVLVPLTSSMYVPGRLTDPNSVLINIGTGYYVETDLKEGIEYFKRKVSFVTDQMSRIQSIGKEKTKIRDALGDMIHKLISDLAVQQQEETSQSSKS